MPLIFFFDCRHHETLSCLFWTSWYLSWCSLFPSLSCCEKWDYLSFMDNHRMLIIWMLYILSSHSFAFLQKKSSFVCNFLKNLMSVNLFFITAVFNWLFCHNFLHPFCYLLCAQRDSYRMLNCLDCLNSCFVCGENSWIVWLKIW